MSEAAEHGLGAGVSIGRHARVRPLSRVEAGFSANQGGTASILSPLEYSRGVFLFRRNK